MTNMQSSAGDIEPLRCRTSHSPAQREMPVLFHLRDVSRVRENAFAEAGTLGTASGHRGNQSAGLESASLEAIVPQNDAPATMQPAIIAAKPVESAENLPPTNPAAARQQPAIPSELSSSSPAPLTDLATIVVEAVQAAELTPTSDPEQTKTDAISPRQRAEQRAQKQRSVQATDTWLRSHGKLLAIGFLIALAGTVFLARMNRSTPKVTDPNKDWPAAHPGDVAEHLVVEPPAASVAATTVPVLTATTGVPTAKADSGSADPSPATLPESELAANAADAPAQPRVDLLPPNVPSSPSLVTPANETAKNDPPQSAADDLFPWKNEPEPRVAALPELPSTESAPPSTNDAAAPGVPGPPTLAPPGNAPQWSAPAGNSPQGNASPSGNVAAPGQPFNTVPPQNQTQYPTTNYREYSHLGPPAAPPVQPTQPPQAETAPRRSGFIPLNSSEPTPPAGGYRNEPYGSGLY